MPIRNALAAISALVLTAGTIAAAQSLPPTPAAHDASPFTTRMATQGAAYGKRSMTFEANRGQTDGRVQFLSRGSNYSVLVEPAQATLLLHHEQGTPAERRKGLLTGAPTPASHEAIRMALVGAKADAPVTGERALQGYVNYISGSDRSKDHSGIPTFAAARVQNPYPGIDLLYYGTDRQLEYDFIVAPQADAAQIKLSFAGATPVLSSDGALRLQAGAKPSAADLRFMKPVLYQQHDGRREEVQGNFMVAKNGEVGFDLGAYDHTRELVIDPIVSYASYFGGSGEDAINGTTLNAANQLYAVGQTTSPSLPSGTGEFQAARGATKNSNYHDAFVTKFSADGSTVLWTTYLAGSQDDFGTAVAVGAADQPYVVGNTSSCGANNGIPGVAPNTAIRFPFTADAVQPLCSPVGDGANFAGNGGGNTEINGASFDAFLVKLSSDGKTELYGTPLGGSNNDFASSVVLDAVGKVYIVGTTSSTSFVACNGNTRCTDEPAYPGSAGYSNYPTTSTAFYSNTTESRLYTFTDPNTGISSGPADEQAFITILSPDLHAFAYSSVIGGGIIGGCGNGACNTRGIAVAVNAAGNAFIAGNTTSAHWPTTPGAFAATCPNAGQPRSQCITTGWAAGFDQTRSGNASLLFSTYMTGTTAGKDPNGNALMPGGDVLGLATDSTGNLILTGDTTATDFPTTAGTFSPTCFKFGDGNGNSQRCGSIAFLTKFTPSGSTVWSTFFGGTSSIGGSFGNGLALDANNNVFLLGTGNSPNQPLKISLSPNFVQSNDAFISSFTSDAKTLLTSTYLGSGGGVALNNNALHLDSNLNAYFGGYQGYNNGGASLPVTPNAPVPTLQGSVSGFVIKLITQQQPSTATLTASPNTNVTPTQSVTLSARVVSTSPLTGIPTTPTGTVQFLNGATVLGTGTIAAGVATFTGTLPAGSDSLTAVYAGDTGFNGSTSSAVTIVVSSAVATSTTLTVSPNAAAFGQTVTLTSTTLAGTTPVTAGTVTFTAGTLTLGTATVGANGVATTTITPAVGTYSVVAGFTGTASVANPNGTASSVSAGQSLNVGKAVPTVTISANTALAPVGGSVTFTARVTATSGTPSGTVNFLNGTTVLGSGTLNAGVATFTSTNLPASTYSVSAAYVGDNSFAAATSTASATLVIRTPAATTTMLTSSALSAPVKTVITFTATVATNATGTPTGTITFYAGATALGTAPLTNNTATYTTSALPAGTASLTAIYSGDTLFLTSTSNALSEIITNPTLSVTATPNPLIIQRGHSGVLTLTLMPSGGFAGTVSFGCGSLPQYVTCVFAPPTLVFTATSSAAQTNTLTIFTNPQMTASAHPQQHSGLFSRANLASSAMCFWLPGSALALFGLRRKSARNLGKQMKSLWMLALVAFSLGATGLLSGCAGSNNSNTATPGMYSVPLTITGTDGSVQTINASITIQ